MTSPVERNAKGPTVARIEQVARGLVCDLRRGRVISCACGCGRKLEDRDRYGRERRYMPGHATAARSGRADRLARAAKRLTDEVRIKINIAELTLMEKETGTIAISLASIIELIEAQE